MLIGCRDYCDHVVTRLVFLQSAQYSGFDLRDLRRRHACRYSAAAKCCRQFLNGLVPFASVQLHTAFRITVVATFSIVAFDQFDFAVPSAELVHLLHSRIRLELCFDALL